MKRSARALAAAAIGALTLSAGALAATAPSGKYQTKITSADLRGTWTINFVKKGSYRVSGPFPGGPVRGTFTTSGSTITFNHERNGSDCKDTPGKYRFKVVGKALTLTKISDACATRRSVLSRTLTKVT